MKCEATLSMSTDWRLHSGMLNQLEAFVKALPSDLVFSHVPAILFHRIQDSVSICNKFHHINLLMDLHLIKLNRDKN